MSMVFLLSSKWFRRGGVSRRRCLPDEIIIDILSRLPAERVLVCRRVCKNWLRLTSSPYFSQLHLERSKPVLILQRDHTYQCTQRFDGRVLVVEQQRGGGGGRETIKRMTTTTKRGFCEIDNSTLCGSCDGLLLFRLHNDPSKFIVCNPVTRENVVVEAPITLPRLIGHIISSVFSIFYHKPSGEYRLLFWYQDVSTLRVTLQCYFGPYQIFTYSLETKLWRRIASDFPCAPIRLVNPVVVNNTLYWKSLLNRGDPLSNETVVTPCESSIIAFDMDREVFAAMPHPGTRASIRRQYHYQECHADIHIFELEGRLCFCSIRDDKGVVEMWVLEDSDSWRWAETHSIGVERYEFKELMFRFRSFDQTNNRSTATTTTTTTTRGRLQDGRELLNWVLSGLTRYHLDPNTVRKLEKQLIHCLALDIGRLRADVRTFQAFPYTKSFVSLTNSNI